MSQKKQYQELVRRYLENKATDEELEVFFHLLQQGKLKSYLDQALGKEQQSLLGQEDGHGKAASVISLRWGRVAAAAVLVAGLGVGGFWYFAQHQKSHPLPTSQKIKDIQPGHNHAILTIVGGRHLDLDSQSNSVLVLQGKSRLVRNKSGEWVYQGTDEPEPGITFNVLSAPRGGQFPFVLEDGTRVWLNAASSLTFPTSFRGSSREVTLIGEAYFEVAQDARKTFVVHAGNQGIQVLGTAFNVNAYPDESLVKTTLITGSVRLNKEQSSFLLGPGEIGFWDSNGKEEKIRDEDKVEAAVSWKNGYFSFAEDDIQIVMRQISRWYDVEVRYEGPITQARFGGDIERDLTLMQVLRILEKSQVHFRLEGKVLTVLP